MNRFKVFTTTLAAFLICGASLSGQEEVIITSTDGSVAVTCLSPTSGVISRITNVELHSDSGQDTFELVSDEYPGLVLHIAHFDTAMYVNSNGTRYYVHEYGELPEDEWLANLRCLYKSIKYPPRAREKGIGGTVLLNVYLDQSGCVENVVAKTNFGYGLEQSALDAVRACSCKWKVAYWGGITQNTLLRLPVSFRLQ